jgi:hypothetical protein
MMLVMPSYRVNLQIIRIYALETLLGKTMPLKQRFMLLNSGQPPMVKYLTSYFVLLRTVHGINGL